MFSQKLERISMAWILGFGLLLFLAGKSDFFLVILYLYGAAVFISAAYYAAKIVLKFIWQDVKHWPGMLKKLLRLLVLRA
jgi:hypothetical protein